MATKYSIGSFKVNSGESNNKEYSKNLYEYRGIDGNTFKFK